MTTIPTITITRIGTGWLMSCACGHETWAARRPGADRAASDHLKSHGTPLGEQD